MQENMDFIELSNIVSVCLDEIVKLKTENEALHRQVADLTRAAAGIVDNEKKAADRIRLIEDTMEVVKGCVTNGLDNVKYELSDERLDKRQWYFPKFFPIAETVERIVSEKCSIARFGDGEFAIMTGEARHKFQHWDKRLETRLKEVIRADEEGMLIAIADNYGSLEPYNEPGKMGIRYYMTEEVRKEHRQFLDLERVYHNTYISRPYALFADNRTDAPQKRFDDLKRIWDNRNVIFVEGSLTRMGIGNDLFSNADSVRRIVAPAVHAFDKYDEILQAALRYGSADTLFLIALGPAAGVLAYDLFRSGFQAIDLGHLDLEYEWYLRGNGERCEVKYKYNNEYPEGDIVEDITDEEYHKQILCVIPE